MASYNDISLGESGSPILLNVFARKFTEGYLEIAREARTASGRAVKDITAIKKQFTIAYDLIEHTNLEQLATLYEAETELILDVKRPDASTDSYTVLLKPFNHQRAFNVPGTTYWSGVTLEMEEV